MALPSSGPLSLNDIQTEFGGANPISLSEYYRGGAYTTSNNTGVPTSGAISIGNFYGAIRQFSFTISSNQTNANLRTLAVNAGWDQSAPVVATISAGVYISSNSTSTPALTISGSFPNGVSLVNNGFIIGMGGAGGNGGSGSGGSGTGTAGTDGGSGGLALSIAVPVSINNGSGTIAGGGGGGGGGGGEGYQYGVGGGGGGGGRSSAAANSTAGTYGFNLDDPSISTYWGTAGNQGTVSAAGSGGAGRTIGNDVGGSGGTGGDWGSSGSSGAAGSSPSGFPPTHGAGGSGGSAGGAVSGNSNITWVAFGTRLGSIT